MLALYNKKQKLLSGKTPLKRLLRAILMLKTTKSFLFSGCLSTSLIVKDISLSIKLASASVAIFKL